MTDGDDGDAVADGDEEEIASDAVTFRGAGGGESSATAVSATYCIHFLAISPFGSHAAVSGALDVAAGDASPPVIGPSQAVSVGIGRSAPPGSVGSRMVRQASSHGIAR